MRVIAAVLLSTLLVIPEASAASRRRSAGQGSAGRACGVLSPSNVSLTAFGAANGCDARVGDGCDRLQPIEFAVSAPPYDFSCAPHTITWDFGDGASATSVAPAAVRHQYLEASSYVVTATIRREGFPSVVVQQSIKVYEIPYACALMSAARVFIAVRGSQTGCTSASGNCGVNEEIQLSVNGFLYDFGCSPHTVVWNFGDGSAAVTTMQGTPVRHRFPAEGVYIVSATVANERQTFTTAFSLAVRRLAVP